MPDVTVRPAVIEDAAVIEATLRDSDRDELLASTPVKDHRKVIADSIRTSCIAWTAECDGVPIAVFGVSPVSIMGGVGSPWLLGNDGCDRVIVPFVRLTRVYIPVMLSLFPVLENMVDVRNTRSARWLKRLGFRFHDPEPHPYSGMPFQKFEMRSGNV